MVDGIAMLPRHRNGRTDDSYEETPGPSVPRPDSNESFYTAVESESNPVEAENPRAEDLGVGSESESFYTATENVPDLEREDIVEPEEDAASLEGAGNVTSDEESESDEDEDIESELEEELEEEEEVEELGEVQYNLQLPTEHQYLGTPLAEPNASDNASGGSSEEAGAERSYWPDQTVITLSLVPISVLLVPGQTIPLQIAESMGSLTSAMLQHIRQTGKRMFGAIHLTSERHQLFLTQSWSGIGITVEIVNTAGNQPTEGNVGLRCIGRQKFRVLSVRQFDMSNVQATVEIIQDFAPCPIIGPDNRPSAFVRYGAWPMWVYRQHDCFWYVNKIREEISAVSSLVDLEMAPSDPVKFSYWVIRAIPFKQEERMQFLLDKNVFNRLRCQYRSLIEIKNNQYYFCCRACLTFDQVEVEIARFNQVFSMSADGPSASYVNPHGYLHETMTVYSVRHIQCRGPATDRDSWFPGYQWTIIVCGSCNHHLGWKFTATQDTLKPPKFYGLSSQSLILRKSDSIPGQDDVDFSEFFEHIAL